MLDELFPGYWRRYYNPSIELDAPKKDLMVSLEGRVLGHIPEMAGASRADIRRFKSFVSDLSFTDRLAYGQFASVTLLVVGCLWALLMMTTAL